MPISANPIGCIAAHIGPIIACIWAVIGVIAPSNIV
jgi:hypothetical protein